MCFKIAKTVLTVRNLLMVKIVVILFLALLVCVWSEVECNYCLSIRIF